MDTLEEVRELFKNNDLKGIEELVIRLNKEIDWLDLERTSYQKSTDELSKFNGELLNELAKYETWKSCNCCRPKKI